MFKKVMAFASAVAMVLTVSGCKPKEGDIATVELRNQFTMLEKAYDSKKLSNEVTLKAGEKGGKEASFIDAIKENIGAVSSGSADEDGITSAIKGKIYSVKFASTMNKDLGAATVSVGDDTLLYVVEDKGTYYVDISGVIKQVGSVLNADIAMSDVIKISEDEINKLTESEGTDNETSTELKELESKMKKSIKEVVKELEDKAVYDKDGNIVIKEISQEQIGKILKDITDEDVDFGKTKVTGDYKLAFDEGKLEQNHVLTMNITEGEEKYVVSVELKVNDKTKKIDKGICDKAVSLEAFQTELEGVTTKLFGNALSGGSMTDDIVVGQ